MTWLPSSCQSLDFQEVNISSAWAGPAFHDLDCDCVASIVGCHVFLSQGKTGRAPKTGARTWGTKLTLKQHAQPGLCLHHHHQQQIPWANPALPFGKPLLP